MQRMGIIDIGSNSIRLVIYEWTEHGAYRIVDQAKEPARLSERIDDEGQLSSTDLETVCTLLQRFLWLCKMHETISVRAVATAAIRNARGGQTIVAELSRLTGIAIDILSGEEEGRIGFLGVMNTMDIRSGFIVDLGGGSTEISLFCDRKLMHSVSFPFGAVNTLRHYGRERKLSMEGFHALTDKILQTFDAHDWIAQHAELPLIGLGGTVRSLCKMDQRKRKYSLAQMHQYSLAPSDVHTWLMELHQMKEDQRKRIDGLTKDRIDIIVTGLVILRSVLLYTKSSHLIVSGAGLRDGLFFESIRPMVPEGAVVLKNSVENILKLHVASSWKHVHHVKKLGEQLFLDLQQEHGLHDRMGITFGVACLLYRIGIAIDYYNYEQHTYYLIANSRLDGLSHRELLLCAMIASFRSEKRMKPLYAEHKDILGGADPMLVSRLGSLLQIASALDRSETQPIAGVQAQTVGRQLLLTVTPHSERPWDIERQQIQTVGKEFEKIWGMRLRLLAGTAGGGTEK